MRHDVPYSEYRASGASWLREIPKNWNIQRIKFLYKLGRGRVISEEELEDNGEYPVFSSQTKNNGCLGYISTYDFDCEQITWTTDGANAGTVFLRKGKHNCTNVCGTLQPKSEKNEVKFSLYCLQYVTQFYKRPDTNGAKIMNGEMAEIAITLPPLKEQTQIAKFLDYETGKMDALIEKQQQLIRLLKEKRQAVISHAVTKGLNPAAPMRDSGIAWLGEVPAHWEVPRIGYVARVFNGSTPSRDIPQYWVEEGIPWISSGKVNENIVQEPTSWISKRALLECSIELAPKGSVIVGMIGQGKTRATCAMLGIESTINQNMAALVAGQSLDSQYLYRVMTAAYDDLRFLGRGANQPALNCDILRGYRIPLPPLVEQRTISEYTKEMLQRTGQMIELAAQQGCLLQERRTALISAAVTGKIDVRNWQPPAPRSQTETP